MTDIGGYRTLAQLGAVPLPAAAPLADPRAPQPAPIAWPNPITRPAPIARPTPVVTGPAFRMPTAPGQHDDRTSARRLPDSVREGVDLLRLGHALDPGVRLGTGILAEPDPIASFTDFPWPSIEPAPRVHDGPAHADKDEDERSKFAQQALWVGVGGGLLQNAMDAARLVKKYPEALRAGRFDPALGPLGRLPTAMGLTFPPRPDNRIIDPRFKGLAASIETGGRTFTRFDEVAMQSSVLLMASLAVLQIGASIPNLVDALDNEGPWYENLAASTSGRAGVLQLAGGTLGATVFGLALKQTSAQAGPGLVSKVVTAGSAPIIARPIFGRLGLASGALVLANELGYFDGLNSGETRTTPEVLRDAAHKTPVLNDRELRIGALGIAGGMIGYKGFSAARAAGGLAGLTKGHVIGGAVVAGLLGAQLLGGLDALDKP